MMTTDLFVIANVKQMRTGGSFRIILPFSEHLGVLTPKIQQFLTVFTIRVSFGTTVEGFRNFGGGGGFEHPNPLHGTPLLQANCTFHKYLLIMSQWCLFQSTTV